MPYNQISQNGNIIPGQNPVQLTDKQIQEQIFSDLNSDDYSFYWTQQNTQPYHGILFDGSNSIDLYIYAWNITPAYRDNPSEKRIQIPSSVNNVGINRQITSTQKSIILGLYNSSSGPLYAAWDTTVNRSHGQKSCYVQIEDIAKAITEDIHSTKDKKGSPIYTLSPSSLGDYISLLQPSNILNLNVSNSNLPLKQHIKNITLPNRKKRVIKKINDIQNAINSLTTTEKEVICKQRVGQGLFKDLLLDKYSCTCALCAISRKELLIGSHIKEWSNSTDYEKLDVNNGLLLCAHHDALFDKHLISFNDDGSLLISPLISNTDKTDLNLTSILPLTVTPDMIPYITYHRSKLKQ